MIKVKKSIVVRVIN